MHTDRRVIDELIEPTSIRPTDCESIRPSLDPLVKQSRLIAQWVKKLSSRAFANETWQCIKLFHFNISTSILLISKCNTVYNCKGIPITVQQIVHRALQSSWKVVERAERLSDTCLACCVAAVRQTHIQYIYVYTITGPVEQSTDMSKVALLV